ncbi:adaptin N terminal region-domain-containing protein [Lipomyces kononenkoae]|uniref:Adaptin N terminal region-domain-containing protein n=1 Tax=Lipomyces kononenkoae TaxID=34357 RepID=A0ACC3TCT9_LIPKO
MSSLKSFIKSVRAAKTMADERAVIQKESAAIRTSFREDFTDTNLRRQNIAKLLYLFTLGERTHFGQIECLKLLATSKFSDKRLGYLGTMLLLDENQEVLTLVTNSLKNDLNHPNQYVVALALCTLGNIASQEMARDLFTDIEKLVVTQNPYLRKKAALCAMRIIRKVPELEERFVDKAKSLLSDHHHGVLICGMTLVYDLCVQESNLIPQFRQFIPSLVRQLKSLTTSGYAPEHDVAGISDPFLQVKILRLLRVLGRGDQSATEQMNDILAQIATNTDSSKNVGNAILYEAVLTILDIDADSGLRVLGINILGRFLGNKDNNVKYVGLNTLSKVVELEPNAVQRHRNTILECLHDADISIRRRALDLSFDLINEQNVRVLVRELLVFLETADSEFKANMTVQICVAADKYAPNKRWHIDTVLRVLKLAGNYVSEQLISQFIALVSNAPNMQLYTVQKLYSLLRSDITQEGLTLAGAWVIGEYGDELLKAGTFEDEETTAVEVKETDIVQIFEGVLYSTYATQTVQGYVLDALVKLSTRLSDPSQIERVRRLITTKTTSLDVEIQQRAVEYATLFGFDEIRRGVLEKMPAAIIREDRKLQSEKKTTRSATPAVVAKPKSETDILLDLMSGDVEDKPVSSAVAPANGDLLSMALGGGNFPSVPTSTGPTNGKVNGSNPSDLLADVFGGSPSSASPVANDQQPQQQSINDILGLFNAQGPSGPPAAPAAPAAPAPAGVSAPAVQTSSPSVTPVTPATPAASSGQQKTYPAYPAFANNGLTLTLQPIRDSSTPAGVVNVLASFTNTGTVPLHRINFQVAVPKTQQVELRPISKPDLSPGENASQAIRVTATVGAQVRLRLRVSFGVNGSSPSDQDHVEQVIFNQFPADLLSSSSPSS